MKVVKGAPLVNSFLCKSHQVLESIQKLDEPQLAFAFQFKAKSCVLLSKKKVLEASVLVFQFYSRRFRPFACSECDFTAKRRYQLRQHQRWHTGELFRCEHCDYAHPLKAEFDRHSKVHVNKQLRVKQRLYACKYVPVQ